MLAITSTNAASAGDNPPYAASELGSTGRSSTGLTSSCYVMGVVVLPRICGRHEERDPKDFGVVLRK